MLRRKLAALLVGVFAGVALVAASGPASASSSIPKKNVWLDVNLYDVEDGIFDATLNDIPSRVPRKIREFLLEQLGETSFEVDARHATCFLVQDGTGRKASCKEVAALVEDSYYGLDASILARPIAGEEVSLRAKKMTVYLPDSDPISPPEEPLPAPARFYEKNLRIDVGLQDVEDGIFDATLFDAPLSRQHVRDYLWQELGGTTFEIDGTHARCFVIQNDEARSADCSEVLDLVDATAYDPVYASVLARPIAGDELSFRAKKITVWA